MIAAQSLFSAEMATGRSSSTAIENVCPWKTGASTTCSDSAGQRPPDSAS